jgi:hypothetical protein
MLTENEYMSIITKEIKDEVVLHISAEMFAKGQISEHQYIKEVKYILGMVPDEYKPEKIKQKKCWI